MTLAYQIDMKLTCLCYLGISLVESSIFSAIISTITVTVVVTITAVLVTTCLPVKVQKCDNRKLLMSLYPLTEATTA
jgi:hypothetical protein